MKAPLSWLKAYVDIDVPAKVLEEKLFSCGFEVEELIEVGKDISGVCRRRSNRMRACRGHAPFGLQG